MSMNSSEFKASSLNLVNYISQILVSMMTVTFCENLWISLKVDLPCIQ